MKLGAFRHLGFAELNRILKSSFVSLLVSHECAKIVNLKCLREVLIVVKFLEPLGFKVNELEIETLGAAEIIPVVLGNTLWDKTLIGCINGERDETIHEGGLALHTWANGFGSHIATVDYRVASEHA